MKFNINSINKKYLGVFATLILVILISQSRVFDFLIETALGRAFLIICILGVSCIHKIFGVISVLFIIIMFNNTGGIMEGLDNNTQETSKTDVSGNVATNIPAPPTIPSATTIPPATTIPSELTIPSTSPTDISNQNDVTATTNTTAVSTTETFTGGREGFNTLDRERSLQIGKRSSQVPTYFNARSQSDNIQPTDQYVFTSDYTSF